MTVTIGVGSGVVVSSVFANLAIVTIPLFFHLFEVSHYHLYVEVAFEWYKVLYFSY